MSQLSSQEALAAIVESIAAVAPEVEEELQTLDGDLDLFDALDLDSMDHLNVMTGLWERTGEEIAERDYSELRSLNALTQYLLTATS